MMSTNVMINQETTEINFRNKFEKLLTDDNRTGITGAFERFLSFTPQIAINHLWRMTYSNDISKICEELDFSIPQENVLAFRNEMRYQYQQQCPKFLDVKVPDECETALKKLMEQTDTIVARIVYDRCASYAYMEQSLVERVLHLLHSDLEQFFFGGIRELGFNREETQYLKKFHMQIYEMLKALYDYRSQNYKFCEMLKALYDHESQNYLTEDTDVEQEVVADEENSGKMETQKSEFLKLSAERIFEHKKDFESLLITGLSSIVNLRKCGFDLNEIADKQVKIRNLLVMADDLNK